MDFFKIELSNAEFTKLGNFIYSNYGIKMPIAKKELLKARLQSRLRANNIESFKEYCEYIFSGKDGESEIIHMIDVVSTNKTDFFREPAHFEHMTTVLLPDYSAKNPGRELKIWSSACSSGEEAYTIGMVVNEFSDTKSKIDFSILGTDISTRILERAARAVYLEDRILPIPLHMKKKYLLRNVNAEKTDFRIVPELRKKTRFQRLNLMDNAYGVPKDFDIVFCRNVLIYFDRETQEKVLNKLCSHLKTGGTFFLGHSESITGLNLPLKQIKPTVFIKTD